MFRIIIEGFRKRDVEYYAAIGEEAESLTAYQKCVDFLDIFISEDNADIHALNDYITHGDNGDGTVNARLLIRLSEACDIYQNKHYQAS